MELNLHQYNISIYLVIISMCFNKLIKIFSNNPKLKTPSTHFTTPKENLLNLSPLLTIYYFFNKIQMENPEVFTQTNKYSFDILKNKA